MKNSVTPFKDHLTLAVVALCALIAATCGFNYGKQQVCSEVDFLTDELTLKKTIEYQLGEQSLIKLEKLCNW